MSVLLRYRPCMPEDRTIVDMNLSNYEPDHQPMQRSSAPTASLHRMSRSLTGISPTSTSPNPCRCCPYGYHIDLDFVRYCEDLTHTAATTETSEEQRQRRDRRRQRKSMEVMLGFEQIAQMQQQPSVQSPLHEDPFEFDLAPRSAPSSSTNGFHFNDTHRASLHKSENDRSTYRSASPPKAPPRNHATLPTNIHPTTELHRSHQAPPAPPRRSRANSERCVNDTFDDVCDDFERTLLRSNSVRAGPHQQRRTLPSLPHRANDTASVSDGRPTWKLRSPVGASDELDVSELDACLSATKPTATAQLRHHPANWSKTNDRTSYYSYTPSVPHHESPSQSSAIAPEQLPAYIVANPEHETDRESVTSNSSEISTGTLQNIRDQMASSLRRMRFLEEQVKQVPVLQQQLKQLRDEKKLLTEQLRNPEPSPIPAPQRISPISLAGLNVIVPKESGSNEVFVNRRPTHQPRKNLAPAPPSPRASSVSSSTAYDESVTSESPTIPNKRATRPPITRDVGVSTNQTILHSQGTNSDLRLYTKQELEAAIDLTIEKQTQSRHRRTANASTQFSPPSHPPKPTRSTYAQTRLPPTAISVATMTSPVIRVDASTHCRPATRTTGSSDHTILDVPCPKCSVRTRTVSAGPDTQMDQSLFSSTYTKDQMTASGQLISLKSMDLPAKIITKSASTQVTPRPKAMSTIGTQSTANQLVNVACQHVPDKLVVQHKVTDTRGLVQYTNQSSGPGHRNQLIDQSTNTLQTPLTVSSGTNTTSPPTTVNSSTSPDVVPNRDASLGTEDLTATPTIKPPHIQFNCPFGCPVDGGYCDHCKEAIRGIAREVAFNPATAIQKSSSSSSVTGASPVSEFSRIPRPTTLLSPRPERRFVRQTTYTIHNAGANTTTPSSGAASEDDDEKAICPAEVFLRRLSQSSGADFSRGDQNRLQSPIPARRQQSVAPNNAVKNPSPPRVNNTEEQNASRLQIPEEPSTSGDSGESRQTTAAALRTKATPSKEMKAALKVIKDAIRQKQLSKISQVAFNAATQSASRVVQVEWFQISSTNNSNPLDVEDYLDIFEEYSTELLRYMVNMADTNGNTAMHYAVSHGNFDVVSILLDSKECDVNRTNNAGYTCVMLVSLAQLTENAHHAVVKRLFQMSDVNIRAKKHSQTALMLAVSHGNVDMVKMLLGAGAEINIQDEDGSTALMCAAEHGRIDIVKLLLAQPDCDSTVHDMDGSTALKISLEAGHRDIGVLLYAHEHITRAKTSPYTSLRRKKEMSKSVIGSGSARGSRTAGGSNSMPSSPMSSRKFLPGDHHPPPRK